MKNNILLVRTKMAGGGNSYDGYILKSSHPHLSNAISEATTTVLDKVELLGFRYFYIDRNHLAMPCGYDRLDHFNFLEKMSILLEDELLREAFPETRTLEKQNISFLTHRGLNESSKKVWLTLEVGTRREEMEEKAISQHDRNFESICWTKFLAAGV